MNAWSQIDKYPPTRLMGSKRRLLSDVWEVSSRFKFNTVADLFAGSGIVSYMYKAQGKRVFSNDYMAMSALATRALVENNHDNLERAHIENLICECATDNFVQRIFKGIYYSDSDNKFIDTVRANLKTVKEYRHSVALYGLIRACIKKRPRGIFTYTGNRYNDGRKDLNMTLEEHFEKAIELINDAVFDNGQKNMVSQIDALKFDPAGIDLVYMDPPYYSPLSDNEYVRRYHFVEGLARDWKGVEIQEHTKTKKFKSYPTLFSSREGAYYAFDKLFDRFKDSVILVSYSSNSLPTKEEMKNLLSNYKKNVDVATIDHRYSFGNQNSKMNDNKNAVKEYIFIGY